MTKPNKKRPSDKGKSQVELFREKARELGADKPANVDEVMKRLAGQRRHEEPSKKKPSR